MTKRAGSWPRCEVLKRDGSLCGSTVAVGADGGPAAACAHHLKAESLLDESAVSVSAAEPEPLEPEPLGETVIEDEPGSSAGEAIGDLRARLKADIGNEATYAAMRRSLLEGLNATKTIVPVCSCGRRVPVQLPDLAARAVAVTKMLDAIEPRLGTADPEPDIDSLVTRPAETLTAAERAALLAEVRRHLAQQKAEESASA